jgi:hypothetical protein
MSTAADAEHTSYGCGRGSSQTDGFSNPPILVGGAIHERLHRLKQQFETDKR